MQFPNTTGEARKQNATRQDDSSAAGETAEG